MAGNNENVNLLISAAVDGLKNIEALVSEMEQLEQTGNDQLPDSTKTLREGLDDTSGAMQQLRARLENLTDQKALIGQFASLKKETQDLADQQEAASQRATELGRALALTEEPTRKQTTEFERARKAAKEADTAWQSNQVRLQSLRKTLNDAGISTKDLAGAQQRVKSEITEVDAEVETLNLELKGMRDSAVKAAKGTDRASKSTQNLGEESEKTGGRLSKMVGPLKVIGAAVAGYAATAFASITTFTLFSRSQGRLAEELTATSKALNISREALQIWQIAGERVGLTGDSVVNILGSITERIGELSAAGTGEAADVFEKLNLDISQFNRLSPDQQLLKLGSAIEQLDSKAEQIAFLEMLGSDAARLQPLLENNAAGLREIAAAARDQGAVYSDAQLDQLNKANQVYRDIELRILGLKNRIGSELTPAVVEATEKVLDLFDQAGAGDKLIETFQKVIDWGARLATNLVTNSETIIASFTKLMQTASFLGNSFKAVFQTVQAAAAGFLTIVTGAIASFMTNLEVMAGGLNQIGLLSDEAFQKLAIHAHAARESTKDLAQQTLDYGKAALESGRAAAMAFDNTAPAVADVAENTERAAENMEDLGNTAETALDKARQAARETQGDIEDLNEALSDIGLDPERYASGLSTIEKETLDTFGKIANNAQATGKQVSDALLASLAKVESEGALARLEKQYRSANDAGKQSASEFAAGLNAINGRMQELRESGDASTELAEKVEAGQQRVRRALEDTQATVADTNNAFRASGELATSLAEQVVGFINAANDELATLGVAAQNSFKEALNLPVQPVLDDVERLKQGVEEAQTSLADNVRDMLTSFDASGVSQFAAEVEQAKNQTLIAWSQQELAYRDLMTAISDGSLQGEQLVRQAERAQSQFDLLDQQSLSALQSAIASARNEMDAFSDSAANTLTGLQNELDRLRGNMDAVEQRRLAQQRAELEAQIEQARALGDQQALNDLQEALKVLEQINQERQKQQDEAAKQANNDRTNRNDTASSNQTTSQQPTQQPSRNQTVDLQLPSGTATISGDPADMNRFMEYLEQAGLRASQ